MKLATIQLTAEAQPNERAVSFLPTGERLGVTHYVRHAYGRVSRPYEGLEEFVWLYEVWTPEAAFRDASWPHIKEHARGWRTLPLGAAGEAEALRLLAGAPYADVLASRAPVKGVGA